MPTAMTEESSNWPEFAFTCNGGGGCVIVERKAESVVISDSKNPQQPGLVFSEKEYADFRRRVRGISRRRMALKYLASVLLPGH